MKRALFLKSAATPLVIKYVEIDDNKEIIIKEEVIKELTKDFQPSTNLFNEIDKIMVNQETNYDMLDAIYVASGPGSYTGARLLVTIVKTIALLYPQIEVFDASILDIFTESSKRLATDGEIPIFSISYARKNKYYFSGKDLEFEIGDTIYATQYVLSATMDACYVNGIFFENGLKDVEDIPTTLLISDWYIASKKVEDISFYEPYYLEAVNIG